MTKPSSTPRGDLPQHLSDPVRVGLYDEGPPTARAASDPRLAKNAELANRQESELCQALRASAGKVGRLTLDSSVVRTSAIVQEFTHSGAYVQDGVAHGMGGAAVVIDGAGVGGNPSPEIHFGFFDPTRHSHNYSEPGFKSNPTTARVTDQRWRLVEDAVSGLRSNVGVMPLLVLVTGVDLPAEQLAELARTYNATVALPETGERDGWSLCR